MRKDITQNDVRRDGGFKGSDFGKWVAGEKERSGGTKYLKLVVKKESDVQ